MKTKFAASALGVLAAVVCLVCAVAAPAETALSTDTEPPIRYLLTIGDRQVPLSENEEITLEGEFRNPKILLKPGPHRHFSFAGVGFDYPKQFAFSAKKEGEFTRKWMLTGDTCMITVFTTTFPLSVEDYIEGVKGELGKCESAVTPASATYGNMELKGLRLDATLSGTIIRIEAFALPTAKGSRLLSVQDLLTDEGETSENTASACKVLCETLTVSNE